MAIKDLIGDIQTTYRPRRELDKAIALAAGYTRSVTGNEKDENRQVSWRNRDGEVVRLPFFTRDIQSAYQLAQEVLPGNIGGVMLGNEQASAKLNDGAYFTAVNPALAICAAVLATLPDDENEAYHFESP